MTNSKLVFYGAGYMCKKLLGFFKRNGWTMPIELWDLAAENKPELFGIQPIKPRFSELSNEYSDVTFVITIENREVADTVYKEFANRNQTVKVFKGVKKIYNAIAYGEMHLLLKF
jgi:hypothetical protein